jgi:molybdopterin converting factor small subunit
MLFEFYGPLRAQSGLKSYSVEVKEEVILLDALRLLPDRVRELVMDEEGKIRSGILILVNDVDARSVYGLSLRVRNEDRITLIPTIHGGGPQNDSI